MMRAFSLVAAQALPSGQGSGLVGKRCLLERGGSVASSARRMRMHVQFSGAISG